MIIMCVIIIGCVLRRKMVHKGKVNPERSAGVVSSGGGSVSHHLAGETPRESGRVSRGSTLRNLLSKKEDDSKRWHIFVSYRNDDIGDTAMGFISVLTAMGATVFNQKRDFAGDKVSIQAMEKYVRQSGILIAFITPRYFDSVPCRAEVEAAAAANITIIPVHSAHHHSASQILAFIPQLSPEHAEHDPKKVKAIEACFRRGENLIAVVNPEAEQQVNRDIMDKIIDRFVKQPQ